MKYGKSTKETIDIREVENGIEIGGSLTEKELIEQGYKPVCEIEQPSGTDFYEWEEYDTCFIQVWKKEDEEIQEDEIWTSDSGVMPQYSDLERLQRDVVMITANINTMNLTNKEALAVKDLYPVWSADGEQVEQGDRYQFEGKLYEVTQSHTTQEAWSPANQSSLWEEVTDHEGTLEDPIPYNEDMNPWWQGMTLHNGKYYTQGGVIYKCIRDSGIKLTQNLSTLIGNYVELVK